jgi:hypothetical protein
LLRRRFFKTGRIHRARPHFGAWNQPGFQPGSIGQFSPNTPVKLWRNWSQQELNKRPDLGSLPECTLRPGPARSPEWLPSGNSIGRLQSRPTFIRESDHLFTFDGTHLVAISNGWGTIRELRNPTMHETRGGRPEGAAAIWNWGIADALPAEESVGKIRLRGGVRALIAGSLGGLIYYFLTPYGRHFGLIGTIVISIACIVFLAAMLSPKGLYAIFERMLAAMSRQFGRILSWLVLPGIFYGVFLPFGALLRRGKRDNLQTFYDSESETYWSDRDDVRTASKNRMRQY